MKKTTQMIMLIAVVFLVSCNTKEKTQKEINTAVGWAYNDAAAQCRQVADSLISKAGNSDININEALDEISGLQWRLENQSREYLKKGH